ncbi:WD40-repeat-containing domain protein [Trametes meyenii]|nr:WD40-repeat-containing domain protein [Trametes meyenii]
MAATEAWDVYAQSLMHLGHGYPLWVPDCDTNSKGLGVEVGDVGWIRQGAFRHLLRCRATSMEQQPFNCLPHDYEAFNPPNVVIDSNQNKIVQRVLASKTVKVADVSAAVSVNVPTTPVAPGASIKFTCADTAGAVLLLYPRGEETFYESRRHIITYMRANVDKWVELANGPLGMDLKKEDLRFVCGVTKTAQWAVAAFNGSRRDAEGSISCDLGPFVSVDARFNISTVADSTTWYNAGPLNTRRRLLTRSVSTTSPVRSSLETTSTPSSSGSSPSNNTSTATLSSGGATEPSSTAVLNVLAPDSGEIQADQCIFFHYYKMKSRFWIFPAKIEAGAGPHRLPRNPDDRGEEDDQGVLTADDGSRIAQFDLATMKSTSVDPVDPALDYILEVRHSEAEVAIVSDLDLYALFKDQDFPNDMAFALAQLEPNIDVDENGVGTYSVDVSYIRRGATGAEVPIDTPNNGEESVPGLAAPLSVNPATGKIDGGESVNIHGTEFNTPPQPFPDDDDVRTFGDKGKEVARPILGDASSHEGAVMALVYSPDGSYLASGSEDATVIIWYPRENSVKRKIYCGDDATGVSALVFSPDNSLLAVAFESGEAQLWRLDALGEEPRVLPGTNSFLRSLAFTPDGSKLLGGPTAGTLVAWDTRADPVEKSVVDEHRAAIIFIIFSADGKWMATGGTEGACRVWEVDKLDQHTPKWILRGHRGVVTSAAFFPDGRRILTGSDDNSCRIWSLENGEELVHLHEHTGPVWTVACAPDGKRVVSGSSDSTVKVCDAWTGECILSLDGHDGMVNAVAYSPDGTRIASAAADDTVRLWNAADGSSLTTYNEHSDNVTSVLFSPDGTTLASGSHDGAVYIRKVPGVVE